MTTGDGRVAAVMQPYLFPYLGYVNLLHAVDVFVVLDDVAFITRGWINRNRILERGEPVRFTLPVRKASQNRPINDHEIADPQTSVPALRTRIAGAYRNRPADAPARSLLDVLGEHEGADLTSLLVATLRRTADVAGIDVEIVRASDLGVERRTTAEQRIIDLARHVGATRYVNLPGGRELYDATAFGSAGLDLQFIEPALPPYPQDGVDEFVPGLSVLDVFFHVPAADLDQQVAAYELLPG